MKFNALVICTILTTATFISSLVFADVSKDESTKEKMEEVGRDTKRGAKKAWRGTKDKSCEMVNGKMECAAKKAKHSIQNGADNVEDAID